MRTPANLDEWKRVLGSRVTRRHRLELASACPVCGGEDRFHVRIMASGKTLAGCRGCIDGRPEPERRAAFGAVLRPPGSDHGFRITLCGWREVEKYAGEEKRQ